VIFFDTNVLVYATIDQNMEKFERATQQIDEAIQIDSFCISPLVLSEYIFILSKLKIIHEQHEKVMMFSKYVVSDIDNEIVIQAYALCSNLNFCKNINDVMHLKIAEQSCQKLVTFDSDFKRLQKHTNIEIEILK